MGASYAPIGGTVSKRVSIALALTSATVLFSFACVARAGPHVGLGKILTTADGGQIFGFDIDQHGNDGVLASARTLSGGNVAVSVETFDQNSGKITASFARDRGSRNSYGIDGIFAGDVALVTHYVVPKGQIYATRYYETMNPVTANRFTGNWAPPIADIDVLQSAENQTTTNSVLFAIELKNQDAPDLVVSNIAANTVSNVIHLDPNLFGLGNGPQLGAFAAANRAVFALSPDGGAVNGAPPINVSIDLTTGKSTRFNGYNNGPFHAGYVTGLAVDPNTGIAATATELNAQIEFYDLAKQTRHRRRATPLHGRRRSAPERRRHRGRPGARAVPRRGTQLLRPNARQRARGV